MSGHTPGPWRWWTSCSFNRLSSDATGKDGDVLRGVKYSDGVCGVEGCEADMRLIAAAPNLLAFAQAVVELSNLVSADDLLDGLPVLAEQARAAIAKATGGAE